MFLREDAPALERRKMYLAKIDATIDNGKGAWNSLLIGIYEWNPETNEEKRLGEYVRNYLRLMHTFCPFVMNGKDYALYSADYTTTRVMSLPECKDLGGEDRDSWGFCPTDYYVHVTSTGYLLGFVAGCYWGDDSDWKVQYLDLRRADQGIIQREEKRFGRLAIPNDLTLEESLDIEDWSEVDDESTPEVYINIKTYKHFWWTEKDLATVGRVKERSEEIEDIPEP
jgi:hypothetical protein